MARAASVVRASVSRRIKDDNQTAIGNSDHLTVLNLVQRTLNAARGSILVSETLTTVAGTAIYNVTSAITQTARVKAVRRDNEDLDETNWRRLKQISNTYLTDQADPVLGWAVIGDTRLVLFPTPRIAGSVTTIGHKITDLLSADATLMDVPNEDEEIIADLTTAILLLRQRDSDMVSPVLQAAIDKVAIQQ